MESHCMQPTPSLLTEHLKAFQHFGFGRRWLGLQEANRWRWHWHRVPRAPAGTGKSASTVLQKKRPKLHGGGAGFVWDLDSHYTLRVSIGIFLRMDSAKQYGGAGFLRGRLSSVDRDLFFSRNQRDRTQVQKNNDFFREFFRSRACKELKCN